MKVNRGNFDDIYQSQDNPWAIGDADSERYNLYYDLILEHSHDFESVLDIGCGLGAFLNRFSSFFTSLYGIDISETAIQKAQKKYSHINFQVGSADRLPSRLSEKENFSLIIYSDVIYYFNEVGKNNSLRWISEHIEDDGLVFIAAWVPGGQYLEYDELKRLIDKYLYVENDLLLDSKHAIFICRKRKKIISVTIDYETWHPIPDGMSIDWMKDVIDPTNKFIEIANNLKIPLTFMVEMGEYFWLKENKPNIASLMEKQWQYAVKNGHDIQLHLHPNWLPELGAKFEDNLWFWDWKKCKLADYPGEIVELIHKCKITLESIIKPIKPDYTVTSFRAGTYQIQPFKQIYDALIANDILCDSSVFLGGYSPKRGYDFRLAFSDHQPYFANPYDPQLLAPPSESKIIELPIFTYSLNERWFLDNDEAEKFAERLITFLEKEKFLSTEVYRFINKIKRLLRKIYFEKLKTCWNFLNPIIPKWMTNFMLSDQTYDMLCNQYFVMIGHTKGIHDFNAINDNFLKLITDGRFEFVTLSELADKAKTELAKTIRSNSNAEKEFQVTKEYFAIMGEERNEAQSFYLQELIPRDRKKVLDLGCGAGYWSSRIAEIYPWMKVIGVDCGEDFINKAIDKYQSRNVNFQLEDFSSLSFEDNSFDCIYADNTLEHAFNVDKTLSEIFRVLNSGGVLIAAIPSDARNPSYLCLNHTWKTAPHEVQLRLINAGFSNIEIIEIDTFKKLGMPPYLPSNDQMMYIKAWKRKTEFSQLDRAIEVMNWIYKSLDPTIGQKSNNPKEIIADGYAWCAGSSAVMKYILESENFSVRQITFYMDFHPKGRGKRSIDTHSCVEVYINNKWQLFDPMCNFYFGGFSFYEIQKNPDLMQNLISKHSFDLRFTERNYNLYCSKFAYEKSFWVDYEYLNRVSKYFFQFLQFINKKLFFKLLY